jgi:hypothetical protein
VRGAGALDGAGRVRAVGSRADGRCLRGGGGQALRFTSKPLLTGQSLYALVSYRVAHGSSRPGTIAAAAPSRSGSVPLDRPAGHELVNLGRSLDVALPPGARACVRSLAVGWLGSNGR